MLAAACVLDQHAVSADQKPGSVGHITWYAQGVPPLSAAYAVHVPLS
jgi:hypothetical protein